MLVAVYGKSLNNYKEYAQHQEEYFEKKRREGQCKRNEEDEEIEIGWSRRRHRLSDAEDYRLFASHINSRVLTSAWFSRSAIP